MGGTGRSGEAGPAVSILSRSVLALPPDPLVVHPDPWHHSPAERGPTRDSSLSGEHGPPFDTVSLEPNSKPGTRRVLHLGVEWVCGLI